MTMNLESPFLRYELVMSLKDLADRDLHKKWFGLRYNLVFGEEIIKGIKKASTYDHWVESDSPTAFWSNFYMEVDCLFNDLNFQAVVDGEADVDFQVGHILFDSEEAQSITDVVWILERIYKELGAKQAGTVYLSSPLWDSLVSYSHVAYNLLVKNNQKHNLNFEELWEQQRKECKKREVLEKMSSSLSIPLIYPYTRRELLKSLERLQGLSSQHQENIPKYYHYLWDSFDSIRDFLCTGLGLDFCALKSSPFFLWRKKKSKNFHKGRCLFDSKEADVLIKVAQSLEKVYKEVGDESANDTYINSPLWGEVVSSAQEAYELLVNNNKKYGLDFEELWKEEESKKQGLTNDLS